jgi:hypothetical protein
MKCTISCSTQYLQKIHGLLHAFPWEMHLLHVFPWEMHEEAHESFANVACTAREDKRGCIPCLGEERVQKLCAWAVQGGIRTKQTNKPTKGRKTVVARSP